MKKINYESEVHIDNRNFLEKFLEKIAPKKFEGIDWARWKRKNLTLGGLGRFCWAIARAVIIIGICFMILYPFLVKLIVSFMSTNDLTDKTVMFFPREGSTYFIESVVEKQQSAECMVCKIESLFQMGKEEMAILRFGNATLRAYISSDYG
ncbi:MAG: hypothetical protein IJO52_07645, partial [Clostridia bacterium]|nr:hypothetical protein [Clostridia bacterium]